MSSKKQNNYLNIFKFISCFLIVGSHSLPLFKNDDMNFYYGQWLFRFCVPLFFISSGFFFAKMDDFTKKKYIKRLILVYLISTIIYIPLILKETISSFYLIKNFLFGYFHLWYIVSLTLGLIIAHFVTKKFKLTSSLLSISAIFILLGAFFDEYHRLFNIDFINNISLFLNKYVDGGRNFLLFAFPMILIGMILYKEKEKLKFKNYSIFIMIVASFTLSFTEAYYLKSRLIDNITNDITFVNYIPAICLIIFSLQFKININTKYLRKIADIIYIIHPLVIYHLRFKCEYFKLFIIAFVICAIISAFIIYIFKYIKTKLNK